jgi:hypothetical protein
VCLLELNYFELAISNSDGGVSLLNSIQRFRGNLRNLVTQIAAEKERPIITQTLVEEVAFFSNLECKTKPVVFFQLPVNN